jgi:protein TonB
MSKARMFLSFATACSAVMAVAFMGMVLFPLQSTAQPPASPNVVAADGPGIAVDAGAPLMHRNGVFRPSGVTATGTVVIEAPLDSKGEVSDARVLSGPDELRRVALQSVLGWHYASEPTAPSTVRVTIQFGAAPADGSGTLPNYRASPAPPQQNAAPSSAPPATIKYILIIGASSELEQKVRAALPLHEGDALPAAGMVEVLTAAHRVDEHFNGGVTVRDGEATIHLILGTPGSAIRGGALTALNGPQSAPISPPSRIRVGGNVQQANLITKVTPSYPPDAKAARIQGIVHLAVVIGKDGTVQSVDVLSGEPLLIPAATEAVKQWVYKPTLLNGNPVEVVTQVDVNFTLSQ